MPCENLSRCFGSMQIVLAHNLIDKPLDLDSIVSKFTYAADFRQRDGEVFRYHRQVGINHSETMGE